jgi:hypothetical protein
MHGMVLEKLRRRGREKVLCVNTPLISIPGVLGG